MAEVRAAHGNTRERDVMQRAAHYNTVYTRRGMRRLSRSLARLGKSSGLPARKYAPRPRARERAR